MDSQAGGAPDRRPGRDPTFVLLCAAVATDAAGLGVLYPLLARIQSEHHLATYSLGLMSGSAFFASLVAQLGVARFLDGRRARAILVAGLVASAGALVWFARAGDLWQLIAARGVGGLAYGVITPAALREAAVGGPETDRGRRLGVLSSSMMVGITVGPLLGSLLATAGGVPLPFEAVAGTLVVVSLATVAAPRPPVVVDDGPAAALPPARLPWRPVAAVLLLAAAAQLPNGLYDALWSRLLTDRGAGEVLIGLSLSLYGLPFMVLAPFGGRLAERRGPLVAAGVSLLVADGLLASYGFVPSPVVILVLGTTEAFAQAVAVPAAFGAVARVFPDERAATGQGWAAAAGTVSAGTAALGGAPLYGLLGPGFVFGAGAALSAALVATSLAVGRPDTRSHPATAGGDPAGTASGGDGDGPGAAGGHPVGTTQGGP